MITEFLSGLGAVDEEAPPPRQPAGETLGEAVSRTLAGAMQAKQADFLRLHLADPPQVTAERLADAAVTLEQARAALVAAEQACNEPRAELAQTISRIAASESETEQLNAQILQATQREAEEHRIGVE